MDGRRTWFEYCRKQGRPDPRRGPFMIHRWPGLSEVSPSVHPMPGDVVVDQHVYHFEDVGWVQEGVAYEWWNVIHEGTIIDMIWYERR